ncbi:MAG: homoserine kinase [Candidatus Obscuribacterales bacterium]|nr:homoserine kinase [Candidatus Obscuribacterales bacterium]
MKTKVTVKVPASTANLGPGFDSLALALSLYTTVSIEIRNDATQSHPMLKLVGPIAQQLPTGSDNLVTKVVKQMWPVDAELLNRAFITISSEIPLARGLGSSAAATIAAAWAAASFTDKRPVPHMILKAALEYEAHPDNLAASLMGGFVVSSTDDGNCRYEKLAWPDKWKIISIIPQQSLSTNEARAVLPKEVSLQDAVFNLQKTAILVAAVARTDDLGLKHALTDRLHEPYRQGLIPLLAETKTALGELPYLGCVISGAGPSVTVIVHANDFEPVLDTLKKWAATNKAVSKVMPLAVCPKGVQATFE